MVKLTRDITWAVANMLLVKVGNGKTIQATFKGLGVTDKQWRRYKQSGGNSLKVPQEVADRFLLIASFQDKDISNLPTILRVIEARMRKTHGQG